MKRASNSGYSRRGRPCYTGSRPRRPQGRGRRKASGASAGGVRTGREPKKGVLMKLGSTGTVKWRGAVAAVVGLSMLATGTLAGAALAQSTSPKQETTFTWADT